MGVARSEVGRVFRGAVFVKLTVVLLSFVDTILINRYLGVALRGEFAVLLNLANLIQLAIGLGIGNAYPGLRREKGVAAAPIFTVTLLVHLSALLVIAVLLAVFGSVRTGLVALLAFSLVAHGAVVFFVLVEDIVVRNRVLILAHCVRTGGLGALFVWSERDFVRLVSFEILWNTLVFLAFLVMTKRMRLSTGDWKSRDAMRVVRLGLPLMAMNLLLYANYRLDVLMLEMFNVNPGKIGLYAVAVGLAGLLWVVPDAFKEALYNLAAKRDPIEEIVISVMLNCLLAIGAAVGFAFVGRWFLALIYGPEFVDAYPLVLVLFAGTFPMILYKLIHPLYVARGRSRLLVWTLGLSAALNIVLNIVLIPLHGAFGAAVGSVVSYSLAGMLFGWKFVREYEVRPIVVVREAYGRWRAVAR